MNIIVTGASKGIGRALVKLLSKAGKHKIISIARSQDKLTELKKECEKPESHSEVIPVVFDLEKTENIIPELINRIGNHFSGLDILINNAGFLRNIPFQDIHYQDMLRHYKINVFSPFELIRGSLPFFQTSSVKHIVNIGTMGGVTGTEKFAGLAAYSSGKGALAILSELLAKEMMNEEISINYLALGAVETDMFKEAFPGEVSQLKPEDIAEYVMHFATYGWKYMNGQIIPVSLNR